MNTLIKISDSVNNGTAVQTMSSREIAELCGKQHKHVMRDIKKMLRELSNKDTEPKFGLSEFSGLYRDSTGRTLPCYNLPKRECLILVSGYSTTLRAKIVDRWQELEKQVAAPQIDYSSPEAMIGFLTHLQSQIEEKNTTIAELKPKAQALESLTRSDGLFGLTEAAKVLEIRPKDLTDYLRGHDWVYRRAPGSPLLPYQDKIKRGLMDCSTITIQRPDGTEKILPSTKITTKGLVCLREQIHGGVQ
ncbi:phage regulatory protein/antirepressor Ant [Bartonella sp. CB178]|uniref:phage regulatory protein/antirepressor Ant n=1 Tax=Bartonella sp. CB178 TaxID=3112255 RepID=UPI00300E1730